MSDKYGWTKAGAVKIVADAGAEVTVLLPGRKNPTNISKTQLLPMPTHIVLSTTAKFDQKCGCFPVLDVCGNVQKNYNIYGSVKKCLEAKKVNDAEMSAHFRRKFLAENGFLRARGTERKIDGDRKELIFRYQADGYEVVKTSAIPTVPPKQDKGEKVEAAAPVAAPATA